MVAKSGGQRNRENRFAPILRAIGPKNRTLQVHLSKTGGAGGIRTLDTLLGYTPLAGERFRPLSHRSVDRIEFGNVRRGKPQGESFVNGEKRSELNFRVISTVQTM